MELIQSIDLASNGACAFTTIPSTYKHLYMTVSSRSTGNADWVYLRINNVSTSNYNDSYLFMAPGEGVANTAGPRTSQPGSLMIPGMRSSSTANAFAGGEIYIFNYNSAGALKTFAGIGVQLSNVASSSERKSFWFGQLQGTSSPVTRIDLSSAAADLTTHTTAQLYGLP